MQRLPAIACAMLLPVAPAAAGAWLQPAEHGQTISEVSFSTADRRYGDHTDISFDKLFVKTYSEYGAGDRITLFSAPEYVLAATEENGNEIRARDSGFETGARIGILTGENKLSLQASFKKDQSFTMTVSTGASGLSGETRLLYGRNFTLCGLPGFLDAEAGWRWTSPPRPNEIVADVTVGLSPWHTASFMLQSFNVVSAGYGTYPYTSYYSQKTELSALLQLGGGWSLQFGGILSTAGKSVVAERGVKLALWLTY